MRIGLAPSARRIDGAGRARTITAIAASLLVMTIASGCNDTAPGAAPTSTLPAPGSAAPASTPTIPAYETDLDLTDEEKKAVDEALVAFEGFWASVNSAYSGDNGAIERFPDFASGEALESISTEAEIIKAGGASFEGVISPLTVSIFQVEYSDDGEIDSSVVVHFCVDTSKWTFTETGQSPTTNPDGKVTMEHQILDDQSRWRVDKQSLWERKC